MTFIDVIALLKDISIGIAAVYGTLIAKKGLDTWRRQLKGQSEYELSRRILITLFKYRDAIDSVRNPLMLGVETPYPPDNEAKNMNRDEIDFYGVSKAYQARWNKIYTEKESLYVDLLESEAIWGNDLKNLFKKVFSLESELRLAFTFHLNSINPKTESLDRDFYNIQLKNRRSIIYEFPSENPDAFKQDMFSAIDSVEAYLKPKLSHEEDNPLSVIFIKNVWCDVVKWLRRGNIQ